MGFYFLTNHFYIQFGLGLVPLDTNVRGKSIVKTGYKVLCKILADGPSQTTDYQVL